MHVLFVGPFPWPSHQGSQVYLAGQARALAERGHRVTVAVYGGGSGGDLPGITLLRGRSLPGVHFHTGGLHWSRPLADLALARAVRRYVREEGVDLIHAHNVEGPLVARLARTGRPVVYDLHTEMRDELASHLPRRLARLARPLGALVDRLAIDSADAGCAISSRAQRRLVAGGLKTLTVGPGIDPDELQVRSDARARFGLPERFVVYTGNLDAYQDLDLLLSRVAELDAPLVVVTGSDAPLPDAVTVIRSRAFQDALDVLAVATVAVIPRRTCAGFPIKLLNQLGMGCPTVMTDSAAQPLPGVLPAPPTGLVPLLNALLADPERARELGAHGREAVLTDWTWAAKAERLESLYAWCTT